MMVDFEELRKIVPELSWARHKGQAGRVGVVGGCREYTGAPYYAAISALRAGADLAHVFCTPDAALAVKAYSPELIVHPALPDAPSVARWVPAAVDAVVAGPGLGRDAQALDACRSVVCAAGRAGLPAVVDGDGLFMAAAHVDAVRGCHTALLTPNAAEYRRLCAAAGVRADAPPEELSRALGGVALLCKGAEDVVTDGATTVRVAQPGAPRRCGGQGDVLAGTAGVFFAWAAAYARANAAAASSSAEDKAVCSFAVRSPALAAAVCASRLTRHCAHRAFARYRRAMLTTALIEEIGGAFEELFGAPSSADES